MALYSHSDVFNVGMILFPNLTQLDFTGPYEVFARMPNTRVYLAAATSAPVVSEHGLTLMPDITFDRLPSLDILFVPGGVGVNPMMENRTLLQLLQMHGQQARYVTSVCTGALLLGAAGLLRGYRATTHWLSLDLLPLFGAESVNERVVIDRNRITGGGVTAGIDFGLAVAAEVFDVTVAQEIQLMLEYAPKPPFQSGSQSTAPADLVQRVLSRRQHFQAERRTIAERAASKLAV